LASPLEHHIHPDFKHTVDGIFRRHYWHQTIIQEAHRALVGGHVTAREFQDRLNLWSRVHRRHGPCGCHAWRDGGDE
jgi:hypothetical protein